MGRWGAFFFLLFVLHEDKDSNKQIAGELPSCCEASNDENSLPTSDAVENYRGLCPAVADKFVCARPQEQIAGVPWVEWQRKSL